MPIAKELRVFYGREWRTVTRPRILARAGNCCEGCKKPNHAVVETITGKTHHAGRREYWMFWIDANNLRRWTDHKGQPAMHFDNEQNPGRIVKVVLTIAHKNHTPGDDRDENLAAWCQWCHLIHDLTHHRRSRETRKDQGRPLLVMPSERTA